MGLDEAAELTWLIKAGVMVVTVVSDDINGDVDFSTTAEAPAVCAAERFILVEA